MSFEIELTQVEKPRIFAALPAALVPIDKVMALRGTFQITSRAELIALQQALKGGMEALPA